MAETRVCGVCGNPNGRGGAELRPYGVNGSDICFSCMIRDQAKEREARRQAFGRNKLGQALMARDDGLRARIAELESALVRIREWDMLNPAPGTPEPLADGPWLRRIIGEVLDGWSR